MPRQHSEVHGQKKGCPPSGVRRPAVLARRPADYWTGALDAFAAEAERSAKKEKE